MIIDPKEVSTGAFHAYMLGAIAPRPIAFVSSIDKQGNVNLSPFSFFNAFGSNPPTVIFSPARRVRDNTIKHTLENVYEVDEVVINVVNYSIVEQMSLASCEYDKGIDEFIKSGLTPAPSVKVKPPRVAESPAVFECKVKQVIETGQEGGAGNLVICEIIMAHFHESVLDENGKLDTRKMDLVARMGGDWYCRAFGEALFEVPKPNLNKGIGVDQIPEHIRNSEVLTGNNLGRLGNIEHLPSQEEIDNYGQAEELQDLKNRLRNDPESLRYQLHKQAQRLLRDGKAKEAWLVLLQDDPALFS
jgi:flavin reductase (DIM6/NTAB) family NADH-FMN oxidoreductase RutF